MGRVNNSPLPNPTSAYQRKRRRRTRSLTGDTSFGRGYVHRFFNHRRLLLLDSRCGRPQGNMSVGAPETPKLIRIQRSRVLRQHLAIIRNRTRQSHFAGDLSKRGRKDGTTWSTENRRAIARSVAAVREIVRRVQGIIIILFKRRCVSMTAVTRAQSIRVWYEAHPTSTPTPTAEQPLAVPSVSTTRGGGVPLQVRRRAGDLRWVVHHEMLVGVAMVRVRAAERLGFGGGVEEGRLGGGVGVDLGDQRRWGLELFHAVSGKRAQVVLQLREN